MNLQQIGLGGGCHWCTEAVFESLKGVKQVTQGFIGSIGAYHSFSEAIIITFNPDIISLKDIIHIHLITHKSMANHSFRKKYRSAIYYFENTQQQNIKQTLAEFQPKFEAPIITLTLPFREFLPSRDELLHYYKKNPKKPFCKKYILPKLEVLKEKHGQHVIPN